MAVQGAPAGVTEVNVAQPDLFKAMDGFLTSIPVDGLTCARHDIHSTGGHVPSRRDRQPCQ